MEFCRLPVIALGLFTLISCPPAQPQDQSGLQPALELLEAGNAEAAIPLLRDFLRRNSRDAEGHCLLGSALSQIGKRAESNQHLRRALELRPDMALAVRLLGVNAFDDGKLADAQSYFLRLLKLLPKDEEPRVFLGQIALSRKQFTIAARQFRLATTLQRTDPHVRILLARALAGARQIDEAKSLARSVHSADPALLFELGTILLDCGEYQEAIARFSAARENYPLRAALEYNLALAHFRAKDFQAATAILERLVETRDADTGAYTLLADAYRSQGKPALAFDLLRAATRSMPQNEQLFLDLLSQCVELVAIDEGLQIAGTALQHHPASFQVLGLRAQLHSLKGERKLAEADYHAAILLSPKTEWLYLGLAMSLMLDNRLDEARTILEERIQRSSGYYLYYLYSEVVNRIGLDSSGLIKPKIRRLLERSVSLNPDFAPSRINLGRLYAEDQEWAKAIEQFRAAIASDPGDKRPYYDLARIYQRRGDLKQAEVLLSQVRKFNEAEQSQTAQQLVAQRFRELRQAALHDRGR